VIHFINKKLKRARTCTTLGLHHRIGLEAVSTTIVYKIHYFNSLIQLALVRYTARSCSMWCEVWTFLFAKQVAGDSRRDTDEV
jgi:hypothetical protein